MMSKLSIIAAVGIAALVAFFVLPFGSNGQITPDMAERELFASAGTATEVELYETLKAGYPDEYAGFLRDMADFANQTADLNGAAASQAGFAIGQQFTTDLRRDNAHYIATAPMSSFVDMRETMLALLGSMADDPNLCARMALQGGGGLTLADVPRIDMELMAETGIASFKAMIAGRDTPVEHAAVTDADVNAVLEMWQALPDSTPERIAAFLSYNPNNPETCAAHMSFERFLKDADDPLVQNVAVHLTRIAVGI